MCTLLLWKRVHPRYRLIAAANRDEYLDRESTPPRILSLDPLVAGGLDAVAGGTWFAVNDAGLVVAVTNRRGSGAHDPARRSRGALVKQLARSRTFAHALESAAATDGPAYNPFILLIADANDAAAVSGGDDGVRVTSIADGAHAITNWDLDAQEPSKAARALRFARAAAPRADDDAPAIAARLHATLADHGGDEGAQDALCVHRAASAYGTRSSTIAFLGNTPEDTLLFHAEGPPCTATLVDMTTLLRHESDAAGAKR